MVPACLDREGDCPISLPIFFSVVPMRETHMIKCAPLPIALTLRTHVVTIPPGIVIKS